MTDLDKMKPVNVSAIAAEGYLLSTGWKRAPGAAVDLLTGSKGADDEWYQEDVLKRMSRGKAVLRQYQADISRLMFVANYSTLSTLSLLMPRALLEWALEKLGAAADVAGRMPGMAKTPEEVRAAFAKMREMAPWLGELWDKMEPFALRAVESSVERKDVN